MNPVTEVLVGLATCGVAAGAELVYSTFESSLARHNLPVTIKRVGCIGMCYNEPLVDVVTADGNRFTSGHVRPEDIGRIVTEHVLDGRPVNELLISADGFFEHQVRIVLENCGLIDPEVLEEYQGHDGYEAVQ